MNIWKYLGIHLFSLLLGSFVEGKKDYSGYYSISVGPMTNQQQAQTVQELVDADVEGKIILLQDQFVAGRSVDLVVSGDRLDLVASVLEQEDIAVQVLNDNLQSITDEVDRRNTQSRTSFYRHRFANQQTREAPDYYMDYREIQTWMRTIVNDFSDIAVLTKIGESHEGKDLLIIEVNKDQNLPAIFIDSGIHAREHITLATNIWIINEILSGTSDDAVRMRENYRWYFMPCVNPDGYQYSLTDDRMWRKNRQISSNSQCVDADGTDLNRNWAAYDNSKCQRNTNPCTPSYAGPYPFSAPETAALSTAILERANVTVLSISIHSYSQLWLVPWGGMDEKPSDYDDLLTVANAAAQAVEEVNGLEFIVGTAPDLLYCAAGGSFDWVKNGNPLAFATSGAAIKYAYSPELRPASWEEGGFIIGPENIHPSGREIFAGVVASVDAIFPPGNDT